MPQKVLIIEDDEGAADLAVAVLKQAGFATALALDGKQGLAKAREFKPDIAMVDLMLPGMHGYTVCEKLRNELGPNALRILVVSSKAYTQDVDSAKDAGADGYLTKPYKPDELVEKIKSLLGGAGAQDPSTTPSSPA